MNFSVIFKELLYFLVGDVLSTEKRYGSSISLFGHQVFSYHSGQLSWNKQVLIQPPHSTNTLLRGGSRNLERVVRFRAKYLGNALIYLTTPIYN